MNPLGSRVSVIGQNCQRLVNLVQSRISVGCALRTVQSIERSGDQQQPRADIQKLAIEHLGRLGIKTIRAEELLQRLVGQEDETLAGAAARALELLETR